jgi:hypothetical protein
VVELVGRAWSGAAPIARVEVGVDGVWQEATLAAQGPYAWVGWNVRWHATHGEHELSCRAMDRMGNTQPLEPPWDLSGFGNNGVHRILVTVRV